MIFNSLIVLLAQAAKEAQASVDPSSPITVNSLVIIMTAAGVLLAAVGAFLGQMATIFLTLRNGMKSDNNAAKADAHAVKQDATIAKLDTVSKQLNGELEAKLKTLASSTFAAGASSVTAPIVEAAVTEMKNAAVATQKPGP